MSKTKEVYQTLKRSISATTNGLMSSSLLKMGSQGSKEESTKWIHPPGNFFSSIYIKTCALLIDL